MPSGLGNVRVHESGNRKMFLPGAKKNSDRTRRRTSAGRARGEIFLLCDEAPLLMRTVFILAVAIIIGIGLVFILVLVLPDTLIYVFRNSTQSLHSTGSNLLFTNAPSLKPSATPSISPSSRPSCMPSGMPSKSPSAVPSSSPTQGPTSLPSASPSSLPSKNPSTLPTRQPSYSPSASPTTSPSSRPSSWPSYSPSVAPTERPTSSPTNRPSSSPSSLPTGRPSSFPSDFPSLSPTTPEPTVSPSRTPSMMPISSPTGTPSKAPTGSPSNSPSSTPLIFYVMGDTPYSEKETRLLKSQVNEIPDDARFVVHVGDMNKASRTKCAESAYSDVNKILRRSNSPVFIIPGDNDVDDCPNATQAWKNWQQFFDKFENNWPHNFAVDRSGNVKENFVFLLDGVLFLGLHIVDGHNAQVEGGRLATLDYDLSWAMAKVRRFRETVEAVVIFGHAHPRSRHDILFVPLMKEIQSLGVPSLYIHGNGHTWQFEGDAFGAPNIIRIQVDRGGMAAPLKVQIRRDRETPFHFTRRV